MDEFRRAILLTLGLLEMIVNLDSYLLRSFFKFQSVYDSSVDRTYNVVFTVL